jgi:PAS domain S-box-containing protein
MTNLSHDPDDADSTGALTDRAARLRAEASERVLLDVLESSPDGIAVIDPGFRYVFVSHRRAELAGMEPADMIGRTVWDVFPAMTGTAVEEAARTAMNDRARTVAIYHDESQGRWVELQFFPTARGIASYAHDITAERHLAIENAAYRAELEHRVEERTRALAATNTELLRANRAKSAFLGAVSHELRTPLNAIIGFTELMYDGVAGETTPDQREYLGDVLTSGRHLLRLITDLLDVTRIESGRMEFIPEPVALAGLVADVREELHALAAAKHIAVQATVDPDIGPVVLDAKRLRQVIVNLGLNAIKFAPAESAVLVEVRAEGADQLRIDVTDRGPAITGADLGRVFHEFEEPGLGGARGGAGLALAVTRRLVEAQGGTVGVASDATPGARFFAILPRDATLPARPSGG